jgi:hypothetical protein
MNYEEIEDYKGGKHIQIDNGDGSFKSFPADESNPEYIAFLAQLEEPETAPDTL